MQKTAAQRQRPFEVSRHLRLQAGLIKFGGPEKFQHHFLVTCVDSKQETSCMYVELQRHCAKNYEQQYKAIYYIWHISVFSFEELNQCGSSCMILHSNISRPFHKVHDLLIGNLSTTSNAKCWSLNNMDKTSKSKKCCISASDDVTCETTSPKIRS